MHTGKLEQLEAELDSLSDNEQWLMFERLARQLRRRSTQQTKSFEEELEVMANDPDIQREIREIEAQFAPALLDGLKDFKE